MFRLLVLVRQITTQNLPQSPLYWLVAATAILTFAGNTSYGKPRKITKNKKANARAKTKTRKQKKNNASAAACGIQYLPFVKGTTWTYKFVPTPDTGTAPRPLGIKPPATLVVLVKNVVKKKKGKTLITLEEKYREVVHSTTLYCDSKGLSVPPGSFFYMGEPPGGLGMEIKNITYEGDDKNEYIYPPGNVGFSADTTLYAALKADIVRPPSDGTSASHPPLSISMERQISGNNSKNIRVNKNRYAANKVKLEFSGRVSLTSEDSAEKLDPTPIPNRESALWFSTGVGLIRAQNEDNERWELSKMTTAAKK